MSKASQGMKLVKWLANQADDVAASADDLKRFGPKAAQVRSLLDFIPTMSDDAAEVSRIALAAAYNAPGSATHSAARYAAMDAAHNAAAQGAARKAAMDAAKNVARNAAMDAGSAEAVGDLITPKIYRTLTNPLAAGREADRVNMNAPENFMDIIRGLGERNLIVNPQDVRSARKLAGLSEYERGQVLEFMNAMVENANDGYRNPGSAYKSLEEVIKSARLIG